MVSNKYGLKRVINASGRMSILGVSTIHDSVVDAMKTGAQQYIEMEQLVHKSGEVVANYLGAEDATIVNSASSGIVLSIAGLIAKDNRYAVEKLYQSVHTLPNEVIMAKGHNVDYGAPVETMVNLAGGKVKEVGYANGCKIEQIEAAITSETVAILYIVSNHCVKKGMPTLAEVKEVATKHSIPLIVDAAAEEDLHHYIENSDLAIFSGSKALEGPTSGIVAGKKEYISYIRAHGKGIGRAMKVGKESIFGLLQALENYKEKTDTSAEQLKQLEKLNVLNELTGVKVTVQQDESGRAIYRGRIHIDGSVTKMNALEVVHMLKNGEVAIYTRDYLANIGSFDIDTRPLQQGDMEMIVERVQAILGGETK
ncbi:L-seryl-tRNA(Ser) seleniumtransferase [Priestia taiwanensis]|uniref:L-seryl-tRNA selenium transferase n=1 Tax=Priestia taiwanensis TaxID=1347902 RepID=A0A917AWI5_9BACI|nr:DgaE family pyridoxal phosphate-dependent ammonia lyase [Priestia taiwanensis]MBM7364501.1 L-seryl-tRNA(Ser) seleniumtransferase [Priestia taiwanensis]GGE81004.1 L-seryl-tRNA selenium transferase [Priestia taiwanensis]